MHKMGGLKWGVLCKEVGVSFEDERDGFLGQRELYAEEGKPFLGSTLVALFNKK